MNYSYRIESTKELTCIHRSDNALIPPDPANSDYQRYLEWLEEGNTPEPWNPEITDGS